MIAEIVFGLLNLVGVTYLCEWLGLIQENVTTIEEITPIKKTTMTIEIAKYEKMKNIIAITKVERIKLKKLNDELILQGITYLDIFKQKDVEIDKLKGLIDQYETALVNWETDNKEMTKILEKYKDNLQRLLDWKAQATRSMDKQAAEISRLKSINLKLLAEYEKLKKRD